MTIATDPKNTYMQVPLGTVAERFAQALTVAETATRTAAANAGFSDHGIFLVSDCSLVLDSFQAGFYDQNNPAVIAMFSRWQFDPINASKANETSFPMVLQSRKVSGGAIYIAGNEYGNFFVAFTIQSAHMLAFHG